MKNWQRATCRRDRLAGAEKIRIRCALPVVPRGGAQYVFLLIFWPELPAKVPGSAQQAGRRRKSSKLLNLEIREKQGAKQYSCESESGVRWFSPSLRERTHGDIETLVRYLQSWKRKIVCDVPTAPCDALNTKGQMFLLWRTITSGELFVTGSLLIRPGALD